MLTFTGAGYNLVIATGVVIISHFSIGTVKQDHYTVRHHNMVVVSGKYIC